MGVSTLCVDTWVGALIRNTYGRVTYAICIDVCMYSIHTLHSTEHIGSNVYDIYTDYEFNVLTDR